MNKILLIGEINFDIFIHNKDKNHTNRYIAKPGGVVLNIANSLRNLGFIPKIYSFLGNDCLGQGIKKEISKCFKLDFIDKTNFTNIIIYIINNKDVKILSLKKEIPVFLLSPKIEELIENTKIIHISPYIFLENKNFEFFKKIIKYKKILSINLSIPLLKNKKFINILKYFDFIFMNFEEAIFLVKTTDNKKIINFLRENYDNSIVTLKDSIFYISKGKFFKIKYQYIENLISIGAGDYFIGGFLYSLLKQKSIEESIKTGIEISKDYIINLNLTLKSSSKPYII